MRLSSLLATQSSEALSLGHPALARHLAQDAQHHHPTDPHHWMQRVRLFLLEGDLQNAAVHLSLVLDRADPRLVAAAVAQNAARPGCIARYDMRDSAVVPTAYPLLALLEDDQRRQGQAPSPEALLSAVMGDPLGHLRLLELADARDRDGQEPGFRISDFDPIPAPVALSPSLYFQALVVRARIHRRLGLLPACKRDVLVLLHLHPLHADALELLGALRAAAGSLALKAQAQFLVLERVSEGDVAQRDARAAADARVVIPADSVSSRFDDTVVATVAAVLALVYTPRLCLDDEQRAWGATSETVMPEISRMGTDPGDNPENPDSGSRLTEYEREFASGLTVLLGGTSLLLRQLLVLARAQRTVSRTDDALATLDAARRLARERKAEVLATAWHEGAAGAGPGELRARRWVRDRAGDGSIVKYVTGGVVMA
jgi:hypothetical protein